MWLWRDRALFLHARQHAPHARTRKNCSVWPDTARPPRLHLQEDDLLRHLVETIGPKKWSIISSKIAGKGSKQVRKGANGLPAACAPLRPHKRPPLISRKKN